MTEAELAQKFVSYLEGYDLYFEAPPHHVDIVAISGVKHIAIEVKLSLNFKVIEQAFHNKGWFHLSYAAVPRSKNGSFAHKICRDYGIGVLEYHPTYDNKYHVWEVVRPKWNKVGKIAAKYCFYQDYMKGSIPGSSGSDGAVVTAFKMTVQDLERYIRRHPGCSLNEALSNIDHHYSSFTGARSSIYSHLRTGVIKTIELRDRKLYLK